VFPVAYLVLKIRTMKISWAILTANVIDIASSYASPPAASSGSGGIRYS